MEWIIFFGPDSDNSGSGCLGLIILIIFIGFVVKCC